MNKSPRYLWNIPYFSIAYAAMNAYHSTGPPVADFSIAYAAMNQRVARP